MAADQSTPPASVPGEADFHLGAPVVCADGHEVGTLVRLIVEQDTWTLEALVVHERARYSGHAVGSLLRFFPDEVVVPIEMVSGVSPERIELGAPVRDFRLLRPYLRYEYQPVPPERAALESVARAAGVATMPPFIEAANKAAGDIEIRRDEKVMIGHQGRRLGDVEDVVYEHGELAGLVVRRKEDHQQVLVPVRFLDRSDDGALFVTISEEQLEHLRPREDPAPER